EGDAELRAHAGPAATEARGALAVHEVQPSLDGDLRPVHNEGGADRELRQELPRAAQVPGVHLKVLFEDLEPAAEVVRPAQTAAERRVHPEPHAEPAVA